MAGMTPGTLVLLGFPPSRTPYGDLRAAGHDVMTADPAAPARPANPTTPANPADPARPADLAAPADTPEASPAGAPEVGLPPEAGPRYVAGAALRIGAADPRAPLVLVAYGAAGPALPALGGAQRAAHRMVGAYVFVDAELPVPAGDWPDAPCGYLATSPGDPRLDAARLRAWRTSGTGAAEPAGLASALLELIDDL